MHKMRLLLALMAIARIHAPPLKISAIRNTGNLAIGILPGQPNLKVVGFARAKTHIARAKLHHPIWQAEAFQHFFGAIGFALQLSRAVLFIGNADQFDFGELVLAYHAACIAPCRPGF